MFWANCRIICNLNDWCSRPTAFCDGRKLPGLIAIVDVEMWRLLSVQHHDRRPSQRVGTLAPNGTHSPPRPRPSPAGATGGSGSRLMTPWLKRATSAVQRAHGSISNELRRVAPSCALGEQDDRYRKHSRQTRRGERGDAPAQRKSPHTCVRRASMSSYTAFWRAAIDRSRRPFPTRPRRVIHGIDGSRIEQRMPTGTDTSWRGRRLRDRPESVSPMPAGRGDSRAGIGRRMTPVRPDVQRQTRVGSPRSTNGPRSMHRRTCLLPDSPSLYGSVAPGPLQDQDRSNTAAT